MPSSPRVSLIATLKNGMPYLPEAMESVAAQTFRDFEVVVQDAVSTDGTIEYLKGLRGIPELHVDSRPDSGVGQACNRALARCRGEIIGTIDADNLLARDALETVVRAFESDPEVAAVYGGSNMISPSRKVMSVFMPEEFDLLSVIMCALVPPFAVSFYSRTRCGNELRFDESLKTCQDFDLWLRIGHLRIKRMPVVLGSTRLSEKSMSCRPGTYDQFCADKIAALERFIERFEPNLLAKLVLRHARAGIHAWAAESLLRIEGESEAFRSHVEQARNVNPVAPQLVRVDAELKSRAFAASRLGRLKHTLLRLRDVLAPTGSSRRTAYAWCLRQLRGPRT